MENWKKASFSIPCWISLFGMTYVMYYIPAENVTRVIENHFTYQVLSFYSHSLILPWNLCLFVRFSSSTSDVRQSLVAVRAYELSDKQAATFSLLSHRHEGLPYVQISRNNTHQNRPWRRLLCRLEQGRRSRIINLASSFLFTTVKSAMMGRRLLRMKRNKRLLHLSRVWRKWMSRTCPNQSRPCLLIKKYYSCYKRLNNFSLDNDTMRIYFKCCQPVARLNFQDYLVLKQQSTWLGTYPKTAFDP